MLQANSQYPSQISIAGELYERSHTRPHDFVPQECSLSTGGAVDYLCGGVQQGLFEEQVSAPDRGQLAAGYRGTGSEHALLRAHEFPQVQLDVCHRFF